MRKGPVELAAAALVLVILLPGSASAQWLLGDSISGVLNFGGQGSTNFFDPVNGYVPGGSSGIQPEAIVADPDPGYVEFMYLNGANGLNVDVDDWKISLLEFPIGSPAALNSWDVWINGLDLACGLDILGYKLFSSNFGNSLSIFTSPHSVHLSFDGSIPNVANGLNVQIGVQTMIPEPGTLTLLGLGLAAGLGRLRRRRARG